MNKKFDIFLDTDVLVSSLISNKGAAYLLTFNTPKNVNIFTSQKLLEELKEVSKRLELNTTREKLLISLLKVSKTKSSNTFTKYVNDAGDEHVIKGANEAKALFLVTYNIKHFKKELIKKDLNILVSTPAEFLQFIRSV